MKKLIFTGLVIAMLSGLIYTPKAEAMDPVTIAILAPIALKAAKIAAPYVLRGLACGGKGLLEMGGDVIDILRLPLGVVQSTLLWPFGLFGTGIDNMIHGGIAPFSLVWDTLVLPIKFFGVDI